MPNNPFEPTVPPPPPHHFRDYAVGAASVLAAFAGTHYTWPLLQPTPMALFYAAALVASVLGGGRGGTLAVVLATFAGSYFFLPPYGSFGTEPRELLALAVFVLVASSQVTLIVRQRRATARENQHRRWLAATLASVGDAVIATDVEGRVIFMNAVASHLTGWEPGEAAGRPLEGVFPIFNETTRHRTESPVEKALQTGRIVGLANHTVLIARDGRETAIQDSAAPIKDDEGVVRGVIMVFRDATAARRTELAQEAVLESEKRFRALVTATSDVVYRMSPDWSEMQPLDGRDLVASNDAPIRDWMEKNLPAFEHARVRDAIRAAVSERRMFELEHQVVRPDGTLGWTFSRAVPILDAGGEVREWFGAASDVTRRKEAEAERERVEAEAEGRRRMYEAALSNTPDLVYVFGPDHRFLYANEALLAMWGRSREEAIGKTCLELGYEPWHAEMHDREIDRVVATSLPIRGEVPFTGTNGRRIYDYIFVPVVDAGGKVAAVAGTTRDVTERRQAEQEIRDQAERLREADRRKDEFLAMLAHELRNPLSAIGNAVMLSSRSGLQEHIEWSMEVITRQMKHLTHLIDDLLDVSRISRGKIELRLGVFDVAPILDGAAATVQTIVDERKHLLDVDVERGELWALVDPTRLEQVVSNLLNNAAKYSRNGGRIRLTAKNQGDDVVISVRDRGIGIPPDKLPQMFELFAQGDRSLARSEGGLGIGLTVVKKLVEMHGGRVEARSEGPGEGSEFVVRLPRAERPASAPPRPTSPSGGGPRKARILVIDDNVDTARALARLLELLGHDVAVAHEGIQGLETARRHRPDFVLLDIGLPGMDGYEVAARLRREDCCRESMIIAVSGYGQDEDRRRSKAAGFDHHLIKPLDHDALLTLLATATDAQG